MLRVELIFFLMPVTLQMYEFVRFKVQTYRMSYVLRLADDIRARVRCFFSCFPD